MTREIKVILGSSIILIVSLIITGFFRYEQRKINQTEVSYEQKLTKEQRKLATVKEVTHEELLKEAKKGDSIQKETANQIEISQTVSSKATQLFRVLLTFENSDQYNRRAKVVKDLVTPDVLKDKNLSGSDKDVTGNSFIDTLKLKSQFENAEIYNSIVENNEVRIIAQVTYSSSKGDNQAGTKQDIYEMSYNTQSNKFTQVKKIGSLDIAQPLSK